MTAMSKDSRPLAKVLRTLIEAGLTNAQAFDVVKDWYQLDDDKRHYPAGQRKLMGDVKPKEWEKGGEFYVYMISRPDGRPCYIGKGKGGRWQRHAISAAKGDHKNSHLTRIYNKEGGNLPIKKIGAGLVEQASLDLEVALIAAIGREGNGGPLVNLTDGGEGLSGYRATVKSRAMNRTDAVRARRSAGRRGATPKELTQIVVDQAIPPRKGRLQIRDTVFPGLCLRVSHTGHKSYSLVAWWLDGRQRRFTIGTTTTYPRVEDARDRAREMFRGITKGIDPSTVGALADAAD